MNNSSKWIGWLGVVLLGMASAIVSAQSVEALNAALADSDRPDSDKSRDAGRKPAEVLTFLGIDNGMTVMDMIAAGGYYTEVLSVAVGAEGRVYAQNPAAVLQFREGANDKAMTARLADNRLPNVERWDHEFSDIGLAPDSLDGAITALNFHDVYNRDPDAAIGMLQVMYSLLKPGGVLGIIDHVGVAGANNAELHRIELDQVTAAAVAAGFDVSGVADFLSNPADDHTQMVFAPNLRGNTDRFLLKLTKPAS